MKRRTDHLLYQSNCDISKWVSWNLKNRLNTAKIFAGSYGGFLLEKTNIYIYIWRTLGIISILDTIFLLMFYFNILYLLEFFSVSELNFIIYLFIYIYIYLHFIWKMNVSDAFYDQLLKKVSKWLKKKWKEKSCSREECLSVFLFTTFPYLHFSSFFHPSVKAEVFIAYFQLGVFIVQRPESFNSSTFAKKFCYCFPKLQSGWYCLLGPLCKRL